MTENDALQAAGLWTALHLFLLVALSLGVVRLRRGKRVGLGDGGVPELTRASRVFGNATEYIPAFIGGLILLALLGAEDWVVHGFGAAMFAGRVAHALGLSRTEGVSAGRAVGMILTWLSYLLLAGALLFYAL